MNDVRLSSVQQFSINRIRVYLVAETEISVLKKASFKIRRSDSTDITNCFKSIEDSNQWEEWISSVTYFDVCINENTHIENESLTLSDYIFELYDESTLCDSRSFTSGYLEDIRVSIESVTSDTLTTLNIKFNPLNTINPYYQSKKFFSGMELNIIDDADVNYGDSFESIDESIASIKGDTVSEITVKLKKGHILPRGIYDISFTAKFKNKTEKILTKSDANLLFMSYETPEIGESFTCINSNKNTILSIRFSKYVEKGLFNDALLKITDSNGIDVSAKFYALKVGTLWTSTAGVTYITRVDLPLYSNYTLEKGSYNIQITFPKESLISPIHSSFESDAYIHALDKITIVDLDRFELHLKSGLTQSFLKNENVEVMLNGDVIDDFVDTIQNSNDLSKDELYTVIKLNIKNKFLMKRGEYQITLWHIDSNGNKVSDYIGSIDAVSAITPEIETAVQTDVDIIHVVLKNELPIEVVEYTTFRLIDSYDTTIDYTSHLKSIKDSNNWEPGVLLVKEFDIVVADDSPIKSGTYTFSLVFGSVELQRVSLVLNYMEKRLGRIQNIEQIDLSHIKISFTDFQSRDMMLQLKFNICAPDGKNYTERFELIENVLKDGQYSFTEITLPLGNEQSLPAGKYKFELLYLTSTKSATVVYSFDGNLNYMSDYTPAVRNSIVSLDDNNLTSITINFSPYVEKNLFDSTKYIFEDSNNKDVSSKFQSRAVWTLQTTSKNEITYVKSVTIKVISSTITIEKGLYHIAYTWPSIDYLPDLKIDDILLDYVLPKIKNIEMSSLTRMYMEFNTKLQYTYLVSANVQLLDPSGVDHTSYFDTLQESNNIYSGMSTDNLNLNIKKKGTDASGNPVYYTNDLSYGVYTVIFWHKDSDGNRVSDYIGTIDIYAVLTPTISRLTQIGLDSLLFELASPIPVHILEEYTIKCKGYDKYNYSNRFRTITQSNNWDHDLREVDSFYLKLMGDYNLPSASYSFFIQSNGVDISQCDITTKYMEGVPCELENVEPVTLSTLRLSFSDEQKKEIHETLIFEIYDLDGKSYTESFDTIQNVVSSMPDLFYTLDLPLVDNNEIMNGEYTVIISRENDTEENTELSRFNLNIPFMCTQKPMIASVCVMADKYDNDGLFITFSPALEYGLFKSSVFSLINLSGMDVSNKFTDKNDGVVDAHYSDFGNQFVDSVYLPFNTDYILTKDTYIASFRWLDIEYMKPLQLETSLDYILYPVEKIEIDTLDTLIMTFKESLDVSYLKDAVLNVLYEYKYMTEDKEEKIIELDCTNLFQSIQSTNNFDDETITSMKDIKIKINDDARLPSGTYRFIISHEVADYGDITYVYAGYVYIKKMLSVSSIKAIKSIKQTAIDTLTVVFEKYQDIELLENLTVEITGSNGILYSGYFKNIKDSNTISYTDSKTEEVLTKYFLDVKTEDFIIDSVNFPRHTVQTMRLVLNNEMALGPMAYTFKMSLDSFILFEKTTSINFMTSTPSEISGMAIENSQLTVSFLPYAEYTTLLTSMYNIFNVQNEDKSNCFGSIFNGSITKMEQGPITYVSKIGLDIQPNVSLPGGQYRLLWTYSDDTFLPTMEYTSALPVISQGVKSVNLDSCSTLLVVFEEKHKVSYIKGLNLSVTNSAGENCTELFKDMKDSNEHLTDENAETDTFYIQVAEDEDVVTSEYTFSLYGSNVNDANDISNNAIFAFSLNIIYMTNEFPGISTADNLSTEAFDVQTLTLSDVSSYYGRYVQLLSSTTKEILTEDNQSVYLDQDIKIYSEASIDTLSFKLNDEIDPCLLLALDISIINDDGDSVNDYFESIADSNKFESREVLDYIKIAVENPQLAEYFEECTVTIQNSLDEDITQLFNTIAKSNSFDDELKFASFKIEPLDDEVIEKYDCSDYTFTIVDGTGVPITKFIPTFVFKTISTVNSFKLKLKKGYTLIQDAYTANMTYVNEPGLLNSKVITAFSYNGDFPLLSTNMGKISNIASYDLTRMVVTFSEALNVNVFNSLKLSVTDADGNEYSSFFKAVTESNSFSGIATIDQLPSPNQVFYELDAGRSLDEGTYTVSYDVDITANDNDDSDAADIYEIFSRTGKLSYMIKESTNSITDVSIIGSSKLKMEFENAIDSKLLRTLTISCMNQNTEYTFDSFKPLTASNNFGMIMILFEQRYFLYSYDAISWERFDTKQNETFNDISYIPSLKRHVIACNKGKFILIDDLSQSNVKVVELSSSYNINSIEFTGTILIACCNNGKVLSSTNGENWSTYMWNGQTEDNLTDVSYNPEVGYFVVGYKGTAHYSYIKSGTPVFHKSELSTQENLTCCVYHSNYKDEEGESVEVKSGYYVTGTHGLILYSKDGKGSWERLNTGTSKTLYSITSFEGTLIAVGDSGTILMSTDGETWNNVSSGVAYPLKSIDYCDSLFIITSQTGDWLTSKTGTKWTVNSSTFDSKIKAVKYIDSQYESNRNIKYCYFELKNNTELGAVNFYSGEDVPSSGNNPEKYWISDLSKKTHLGDIYIRHFTDDSGSSNIEYYQYSLDDGEYKWNLSATIPTAGLYTFYINTVDADDEVVPLYPQKSDVPITYLTTKTGTMTSVTYNDPSKISDVEYMYPYLNVGFTSGNEIASHYASFKLKNNTVSPTSDFSNCFKSIEQGTRVYKGTSMSNIILFANPSEINKLKSDTYTMKWFWSPFSDTEYDIINNLKIKTPFNLISNIGVRYIDGKPTPDTLEIQFSKNIPLEYFSDTSKPYTIYLNKIPLKSSDDSTYNYISQFQGILDVTPISDPDVCVTIDGVKYLTKIYLKLITNGTLSAGSYLFKMYNDNIVFDTDETELNYATFSFKLNNELTTNIPKVSSVSLVKYKNTINTLDGHTPNKYEGLQDPRIDDDLTSNWFVLDAQNSHVGDIYTNTTTNISYGFTYDNGIYFWKPIVDKPNLCVSFSEYPQLDYVLSSSFELVSKTDGTNYTQLFETDPGDWTYTQSLSNGTYYVSRIYIPLDETKSFPGGDCTFKLKWAEGTPFDTLECDALNLKSVIHDYGKINKLEVAGYDVLHIEFSSEQSTSFLKSLEWDLERIVSSSETESVTDMFHSIRESNNNFENIVKTKDVYLQLLPNCRIPSGTYILSMIGDRDKSDLLAGIVEDPTVSFETRATLTYVSANPPDDMKVSFSVEKAGFTKPVLTVTFIENFPDYGSIANFTLSVTRQSTGKDYSDYFCDYGSNEIKYTRVNEDGFNFVKEIHIPLKNDCAMKSGTYDVVFKFAKNTQLPQIPSSGYRSFTLSSSVMTPLGRIRTAKTKPLKNMVVSFVLNSSIKNITALKSSKIGTELGIKSWKDIYNKLKISFINEDGKECNGVFKTKVKASGSNLTLTLEKNTKFDPGEYTVTGYYNDSKVFTSKVVDLGGLISNNIVSTSKDKICYILEETHVGKTKYKVYSSYKKIKNRVNKLKKLNKASTTQYKLCKKCRKKKLLTTSRIKTQIENLMIPGGRVSKAVELLVKNYYSKLVSKEIGCTKCEIEDDTCLDIKTGKTVYKSYGCENYVKKNYPYTYKMRIATLSGSFPRTGSKTIHFKYIIKNGVQLDRGFKANKKGKQSSKFKAYSKKIASYIKKYKKRVSTCKKCKKRSIAKKSSSSFGWGSALMPDEIRTAKNGQYAKKIAAKFNKAFASKSMGCAKANFEFVKSGTNCKLSCTKITKADKTMESGEWKGTFIK